MARQRELDREARNLARTLESFDLRIVFAESCTGGLVSATLTRIPGISSRHCGSAVVYQSETKARWLGVARHLLEEPGPVSSEIAGEMAERVLERTPQADVAASVTGHLGPKAPPRQDGLLFIGLALRGRMGGPDSMLLVQKERLPPESRTGQQTDRRLRIHRQKAAALHALVAVRSFMEEQFGEREPSEE